MQFKEECDDKQLSQILLWGTLSTFHAGRVPFWEVTPV